MNFFLEGITEKCQKVFKKSPKLVVEDGKITISLPNGKQFWGKCVIGDDVFFDLIHKVERYLYYYEEGFTSYRKVNSDCIEYTIREKRVAFITTSEKISVKVIQDLPLTKQIGRKVGAEKMSKIMPLIKEINKIIKEHYENYISY